MAHRGRARLGWRAGWRCMRSTPTPLSTSFSSTPSYAYEDFVEGYRPRLTTDGGVALRARARPAARHRRAGALEHPDRPLRPDHRRDQPRQHRRRSSASCTSCSSTADRAIELQYSRDERFALPAEPLRHRHDEHRRPLDRAARRGPAPPLRLLSSWPSSRAGPKRCCGGGWSGTALTPGPRPCATPQRDAATRRRRARFGPSYFMNASLDLETVWEHDILPLLVERFHGTTRDVAAEFGLDAVQAEVARRADVTEANVA